MKYKKHYRAMTNREWLYKNGYELISIDDNDSFRFRKIYEAKSRKSDIVIMLYSDYRDYLYEQFDKPYKNENGKYIMIRYYPKGVE